MRVLTLLQYSSRTQSDQNLSSDPQTFDCNNFVLGITLKQPKMLTNQTVTL